MTDKKQKPDSAAAPTLDALHTHVVLGPAFNACLSISEMSTRAGALDLNQVRQELHQQMLEVVDKGDLKRQEATLVAQSHTLDSLFTRLLHNALAVDTMIQMEAYMRLALKAQSQCRTTIETLNLMKNPPAAMFVKQANVANGPQQINNGSHVEKVESSPIKQLVLEEQRDGSAQVDLGATVSPIGSHSNVAALGTVKRTANGKRKSTCKP